MMSNKGLEKRKRYLSTINSIYSEIRLKELEYKALKKYVADIDFNAVIQLLDDADIQEYNELIGK